MTDVIILSFLVGFLRGGRVREFPQFQRLWALAAGFLLQLIGSFFFVEWAGLFVSISYMLILVFFMSNREFEDIRILMIGWFLNALVIWANFGKMPVDVELAQKHGLPVEPLLQGTDFKHAAMTAETNLPFLADVISKPFIIPRVISIGDIFIMLGIFLLVQRLMDKPLSLIQLREGKSYAAKN